MSSHGPATATVNIATHLAYDRARAHIQNGKDLAEAESLAESELEATLDLPQSSGLVAAGQWNLLGGDSPGNAYLFAVSVLFAEAARERAGTSSSVDATLVQLINQASADLADDGQLSSALVAELKAGQPNVYPEVVTDRLVAYLASLGTVMAPPDLNLFWDSDGDGVANAQDNCPIVSNPDQSPISGKICQMRRHATLIGPTTSDNSIYARPCGR